jgi:GntR family transcriptional regulator/MocR family aminotransferase
MTPDPPSYNRLVKRISEAIKRQIASGVLGAGAALPSTRSLAAEWGVSRTTVTAAYEQLIAEGYVETKQGTRARVVHGIAPALSKSSQPDRVTIRDRLSAFGQRLDGVIIPPVDRDRVVVDFRYGELAGADFPILAWKKAINGVLLKRRSTLRYGHSSGSLDLRKALQGYLWRARGMQCEIDQIIVVSGSQQGLDLCARVLLDPQDRVIMENPGYPLARHVFVALGAELIAVDVDEEGMCTRGLRAARLAYATPSHQFPLGSVMSAARRWDLLAWAQRNEAYVIEDDYDSEYRFDVDPVPPLQGMDRAGRVIYLGTVSKTLSPTLRIGYLVVPPGLSQPFAKAKALADRHTAILEQEALADLIESGGYERHLRRVRRKNGARRAVLLNTLEETLGDEVTIVGADAGLHVIVWLNRLKSAREGELITRARHVGLGLYSVASSYAPSARRTRPDRAGLVIGYASLDEKAIRLGVRKLKQLLGALSAESQAGE